MKPIAIIIGTRPDAIKQIPVYLELKKNNAPVILISTQQHGNLLDQVLQIFNVNPDYCLDIMRPNQDLFYLTESILQKTKNIFSDINPSLVLVQGDTTTAFASALSAFYLKVPIAHSEAGIRTYDKYHPYPEEMNRKLITQMADIHFAATLDNVKALKNEGVLDKNIFLTGNTVTDALRIVLQKIKKEDLSVSTILKDKINLCAKSSKKIILFTAHRRESFGKPMRQIFESVKEFAQKNKNYFIFYPIHPNPNVKNLAYEVGLNLEKNIFISPAFSYIDTLFLLSHCDLVITDSGGLQEEATSLGVPCMVLRECTERNESVKAGISEIVGYNKRLLFDSVFKIFQQQATRQKNFIYGDGYAANKIFNALVLMGYF